MAWNEEYSEQRPSCEYMLGYAMGRGVKVRISDISDLLQCGHLYAFEKPPAAIRRLESKKASLKRDIALREREEKSVGEDRLILTGELAGIERALRHM